ncbi:uncharacterized protein LOC135497594 [Lineus longissimus]|uniref:uncharacterized protein LOC135497594 n=1 Tax=Lineus longissimus TaxID=88925 RepID=UPI002B4C7281
MSYIGVGCLRAMEIQDDHHQETIKPGRGLQHLPGKVNHFFGPYPGPQVAAEMFGQIHPKDGNHGFMMNGPHGHMTQQVAFDPSQGAQHANIRHAMNMQPGTFVPHNRQNAAMFLQGAYGQGPTGIHVGYHNQPHVNQGQQNFQFANHTGHSPNQMTLNLQPCHNFSYGCAVEKNQGTAGIPPIQNVFQNNIPTEFNQLYHRNQPNASYVPNPVGNAQGSQIMQHPPHNPNIPVSVHSSFTLPYTVASSGIPASAMLNVSHVTSSVLPTTDTSKSECDGDITSRKSSESCDQQSSGYGSGLDNNSSGEVHGSCGNDSYPPAGCDSSRTMPCASVTVTSAGVPSQSGSVCSAEFVISSNVAAIPNHVAAVALQSGPVHAAVVPSSIGLPQQNEQVLPIPGSQPVRTYQFGSEIPAIEYTTGLDSDAQSNKIVAEMVAGLHADHQLRTCATTCAALSVNIPVSIQVGMQNIPGSTKPMNPHYNITNPYGGYNINNPTNRQAEAIPYQSLSCQTTVTASTFTKPYVPPSTQYNNIQNQHFVNNPQHFSAQQGLQFPHHQTAMVNLQNLPNPIQSGQQAHMSHSVQPPCTCSAPPIGRDPSCMYSHPVEKPHQALPQISSILSKNLPMPLSLSGISTGSTISCVTTSAPVSTTVISVCQNPVCSASVTRNAGTNVQTTNTKVTTKKEMCTSCVSACSCATVMTDSVVTSGSDRLHLNVKQEDVSTEMISVPFGWKREQEQESNAVVYYSPSNTKLTNQEDIREYLQAEGTCKCGLECPLVVEKVFNFDSAISSKPWSNDDVVTTTELGTKLCNHKRKIQAMATLHTTASLQRSMEETGGPQQRMEMKLKNRKDSKKKQKLKSKASPYDGGVLVSQLLAQRDKMQEIKRKKEVPADKVGSNFNHDGSALKTMDYLMQQTKALQQQIKDVNSECVPVQGHIGVMGMDSMPCPSDGKDLQANLMCQPAKSPYMPSQLSPAGPMGHMGLASQRPPHVQFANVPPGHGQVPGQFHNFPRSPGMPGFMGNFSNRVPNPNFQQMHQQGFGSPPQAMPGQFSPVGMGSPPGGHPMHQQQMANMFMNRPVSPYFQQQQNVSNVFFSGQMNNPLEINPFSYFNSQWEEEPKLKKKKKKDKRKYNSVLDRTDPCPNIDVRQIPLENMKQMTSVENPVTFFQQQLAMSHRQHSTKNAQENCQRPASPSLSNKSATHSDKVPSSPACGSQMSPRSNISMPKCTVAPASVCTPVSSVTALSTVATTTVTTATSAIKVQNTLSTSQTRTVASSQALDLTKTGDKQVIKPEAEEKSHDISTNAHSKTSTASSLSQNSSNAQSSVGAKFLLNLGQATGEFPASNLLSAAARAQTGISTTSQASVPAQGPSQVALAQFPNLMQHQNFGMLQAQLQQLQQQQQLASALNLEQLKQLGAAAGNFEQLKQMGTGVNIEQLKQIFGGDMNMLQAFIQQQQLQSLLAMQGGIPFQLNSPNSQALVPGSQQYQHLINAFQSPLNEKEQTPIQMVQNMISGLEATQNALDQSLTAGKSLPSVLMPDIQVDPGVQSSLAIPSLAQDRPDVSAVLSSTAMTNHNESQVNMSTSGAFLGSPTINSSMVGLPSSSSASNVNLGLPMVSMNSSMPPMTVPVVTAVTNSLTQVIPAVGISQSLLQQPVLQVINTLGLTAVQAPMLIPNQLNLLSPVLADNQTSPVAVMNQQQLAAVMQQALATSMAGHVPTTQVSHASVSTSTQSEDSNQAEQMDNRTSPANSGRSSPVSQGSQSIASSLGQVTGLNKLKQKKNRKSSTPTIANMLQLQQSAVATSASQLLMAQSMQNMGPLLQVVNQQQEVAASQDKTLTDPANQQLLYIPGSGLNPQMFIQAHGLSPVAENNGGALNPQQMGLSLSQAQVGLNPSLNMLAAAGINPALIQAIPVHQHVLPQWANLLGQAGTSVSQETTSTVSTSGSGTQTESSALQPQGQEAESRTNASQTCPQRDQSSPSIARVLPQDVTNVSLPVGSIPTPTQTISPMSFPNSNLPVMVNKSTSATGVISAQPSQQTVSMMKRSPKGSSPKRHRSGGERSPRDSRSPKDLSRSPREPKSPRDRSPREAVKFGTLYGKDGTRVNRTPPPIRVKISKTPSGFASTIITTSSALNAITAYTASLPTPKTLTEAVNAVVQGNCLESPTHGPLSPEQEKDLEARWKKISEPKNDSLGHRLNADKSPRAVAHSSLPWKTSNAPQCRPSATCRYNSTERSLNPIYSSANATSCGIAHTSVSASTTTKSSVSSVNSPQRPKILSKLLESDSDDERPNCHMSLAMLGITDTDESEDEESIAIRKVSESVINRLNSCDTTPSDNGSDKSDVARDGLNLNVMPFETRPNVTQRRNSLSDNCNNNILVKDSLVENEESPRVLGSPRLLALQRHHRDGLLLGSGVDEVADLRGLKRSMDDMDDDDRTFSFNDHDADDASDASAVDSPVPYYPRNFNVGDLVWGQIRGFPSWPGKLVDQTAVRGGHKAEDGKMWVKWFGDHTITQVEPEKLKTLSEGLEAHHRARKKHRKGRKMNSNLEAAIQEAMMELDRQASQDFDEKNEAKFQQKAKKAKKR